MSHCKQCNTHHPQIDPKDVIRPRVQMWKELPNVHIEYGPDRICAVFHGLRIYVTRWEVDPNDLVGSVEAMMLKRLVDHFMEDTYGNLDDAAAMAAKISAKVGRLPHTKVWMVLQS